MSVQGMDLNTAAITWDADTKRFYETGTRMGVLYRKNGTTYDSGVAWNGLTSVSESPSGAEETALWADDIKYLSLRSSEQFGGTIEAYTYPDEWAECDGSAAIADGVFIGQQVRKPFGLCYRTVIGNDTEYEDLGYKIHLVYNAMASTSQKSYSTINDSPEAITFSWEFTTTPHQIGTLTVDGQQRTFKPSATLIIDARKIDSAKLTLLEQKLYGYYTQASSLSSFASNTDYYTKENGLYVKKPVSVTEPASGVTYYTLAQAPTLLLPSEVLTIVGGSN